MAANTITERLGQPAPRLGARRLWLRSHFWRVLFAAIVPLALVLSALDVSGQAVAVALLAVGLSLGAAAEFPRVAPPRAEEPSDVSSQPSVWSEPVLPEGYEPSERWRDEPQGRFRWPRVAFEPSVGWREVASAIQSTGAESTTDAEIRNELRRSLLDYVLEHRLTIDEPTAVERRYVSLVDAYAHIRDEIGADAALAAINVELSNLHGDDIVEFVKAFNERVGGTAGSRTQQPQRGPQ